MYMGVLASPPASYRSTTNHLYYETNKSLPGNIRRRNREKSYDNQWSMISDSGKLDLDASEAGTSPNFSS